MNHLETLRIDKWLWCARFFKTRSVAADEIAKGRVTINGQVAKASREVRCGDPREEADESQRRVLTQPLAELGLRWEPREIRFVDGSLLKGPL